MLKLIGVIRKEEVKAVRQADWNKSTTNGTKFINPIVNVINLEEFYRIEAKFLSHLYSLEKEKAQQAIRETMDYVNQFSTQDEVSHLKNYLITLTGMIARQMRKQGCSVEKAFSFDSTCTKLIEERLTIENAVHIADELIEFYLYIIAEKKAPSLTHHTVNKVIQFIDEQIESPMTVEGLAKRFDVSTSHLSRIFREHTDITLVEYINMKKVEDSQYHLRFSNEKISDISDYFHFCNQSYYTRIFKKYTGETPRRFRNYITDNYFRFAFPEEENQLADSE